MNGLIEKIFFHKRTGTVIGTKTHDKSPPQQIADTLTGEEWYQLNDKQVQLEFLIIAEGHRRHAVYALVPQGTIRQHKQVSIRTRRQPYGSKGIYLRESIVLNPNDRAINMPYWKRAYLCSP